MIYSRSGYWPTHFEFISPVLSYWYILPTHFKGFLQFFHFRSDKKGPSFYGSYIPDLPAEGSDGELENYRNIAQEMIVLINVSQYDQY